MKEIQIVHEKPEIYQRLREEFGADWDDGVIVAFDGKIYCKYSPPPQKIVHENVHLEEQSKIGHNVWWEAYFNDPEFRLKEEKKAYFAEAAFIKKAIPNREHRAEMIRHIAHDLAGSLYKLKITPQEAFEFLY